MSNFETNTRELLRSSESNIDDNITTQLAAARSEAVDKASGKPGLPGFLFPAGGMALASLLAFVLVYSPITEQVITTDDTTLTDNIELYEDLEFYQWLAENESQLQG